MALRDHLATPERKRRYVRTLFATIADRYDLITVLLSYGRDRAWKRRLVAMAAVEPGCRALDLATGTGDIASALASAGARVVGLDITPRMIELARVRAPARPASFLVGDIGALPLAAGAFDLVTTGYGLRNAPDLTAAIDEIVRVLKPGGRFLSLDFDRPAGAFVRRAYLMYLWLVGGALGWTLHRDPDTYRYIPASLSAYPGSERVAELLRARGLSRVRRYRVLGGLMAIHHGIR